MTFYGESRGIQSLAAGTGTVGLSAIRSGIESIDDGYTVTLTAGASFIMNANGTFGLTGTDTLGAVKWVLKASGAGTIDLADALDPAFGTGATFTPLASLTVASGTLTEYGIDASPALHNATSLSDYVNAIQLRVTIASGTVTLDKIRLQIEPVGGIVGHWSGWTTEPTPLPWGAGIVQELVVLSSSTPAPAAVTAPTTISGVGYGGDVEWDKYPDGSHHPSFTQGILLTPQAGWDNPAINRRPVRPAGLLASLIAGTDYIARPDRTRNDDGYYVEYDGPNVFVGWDLRSLTAYVFNSADAVNPIPGSLLQAEIHYGLPPLAIGDTSAIPGIGTGTIVYTTSVRSMDYTNLPTLLPDPGPVSSVGLFAHDPNLSEVAPTTPPIPPAGGYYQFSGFVGWRINPTIKVQLPVYRYWIPAPGGIPLRQVQREDGLGRSVMRARGTHSVQKSIRQRGYL